MAKLDPTTQDAELVATAGPEEPGLVIRRIRKPDGRYLLLYTFLREE